MDHTALGYVLARPREVSGSLANDRMPDRILSVSECLATVGPGTWSLPWVRMDDADRAKEAVGLGLSAEQLPAIGAWVNASMSRGDWGWPGYFRTLDAAHQFIAEFEPRAGDLVLLGVGLPTDLVRKMLADHPPPGPDSRVGRTAVETFVADLVGLSDADSVLGYELLNDEIGGGFHSWMCGALEPDIHDALGVLVNQYGLIDDGPTARAAAELIERDEMGEPGYWRPWLLAQYSFGRPAEAIDR